jgi:membrane protease YdiL (CAAX protease family)
VLSAPFLEELTFRGILLPWMVRGTPERQHLVAVCAIIATLALSWDRAGNFNPAPLVFAALLFIGFLSIPVFYAYRLSPPSTEEQGTIPPSTDPNVVTEKVLRTIQTTEQANHRATLERPPRTWRKRLQASLREAPRVAAAPRVTIVMALYANAMLFALFHSSVWPSPVPLFFLGFGLAWLAQRSQSLYAPVVAHALFNSVAFASLIISRFV